MDSDPRVLKERGDNDAIQEAARAWHNNEFHKANDILNTLGKDGVQDVDERFWRAVDRLRGDR